MNTATQLRDCREIIFETKKGVEKCRASLARLVDTEVKLERRNLADLSTIELRLDLFCDRNYTTPGVCLSEIIN